METEIISFTSEEDIKNYRLKTCDKRSFAGRFTTNPVLEFCVQTSERRTARDEQNQGAIEW